MPQAGKIMLSHYCGIHNKHLLALNAQARTGRQLPKHVLKWLKNYHVQAHCQATSIFTFTSTCTCAEIRCVVTQGATKKWQLLSL